MSRILVVDASVVVDLLARYRAQPIEYLLFASGAHLAAPDLLGVEVLSALRKGPRKNNSVAPRASLGRARKARCAGKGYSLGKQCNAAGVVQGRPNAGTYTCADPKLDLAGAIPASRTEDLPRLLRALRIRSYPHDALLDGIWALRRNVTAYDAAYVCLAQLLNATLVTRDTRLTKSPKLPVAVLMP